MNNTKLKTVEETLTNSCYLDHEKFDKIIFDLTNISQPFTGERYTPGAGVQICYEHLHRYLFATQLLKAGQIVLDLGCGVGYGSILLASYGVKVISVDIDPVSTENLKEIARKYQLDNIIIKTADVADHIKILNELGLEVDIVVCHEVIEHLDAKTQKEIISSVGSGNTPYKTDTLFLVSTPDKALYDQHLSSPNPFHVNELNLAEFQELLKSNFKNTCFYEQNTATANYLKILDNNHNNKVSFFDIGWQNSAHLVPSLSKANYPQAEYIYAVACNQPLQSLPTTSLLLDANNQYIRERLSIAAKELNEQQLKVATFERITGQLKSELNITTPEQVQSITEEVPALKELINRQAKKIVILQSEAERVGYEREQALAQVAFLKHRIAGLEPWHAMAGTLLGDTPEACALEVHRLRSYESAMHSSGHRIVTVAGKIARKVFPVKALKRSLKFLKALYQA